MKRWRKRGTWARFAVLFALYLLLPALVSIATDFFNSSDLGMMLSILLLFIVFPCVSIVLAVWDGITAGFTVLWIAMPFLLFLAPMLIFFNESVLIYGGVYSVLAIIANGMGGIFHSKHHNANSVREG
ncbi:hypothetical protein [Alloscardovia criceti]|uniref:hypothetical protein n=1 Tax=Alloscardovia criceti TaxID=356828 RepID=UPI000373A113|nr:hypothetical protein [Alloscardovia criceti]